MTAAVSLTLRSPLAAGLSLEADVITPDRFAALSEREIARLPLHAGSQTIPLGELFDVHGERSTSVRLTGDLSRIDAIGAGMTTGEMVVNGPVGRYAGTRLAGGTMRVLGDAGDGAGLEMTGGLLVITGNAGNRTGAARLGAARGMLGGEIIVRGSTGAETGARMRRGTIVCGSTGPRAGEGMIAGNIVVLRDADTDPGRFNKRGTLVVLGRVAIPITYRHACTYRPPHLAVTFRYLRKRHDLPLDDSIAAAAFDRYSGDMAELGRGEILAIHGIQ